MPNSELDITPYLQGWRKRAAEAQKRMAERKRQAYVEAQKIAHFLRETYACTRIVGIGSTFNEKNFREHSDIDLVVFGLPRQKYFSILAEVGDLTSFKVDLIPVENARPLIRQLVEEEGVEL